MKLFVMVLNKEEYLDEILEAFLELDVHGATVIDSVGMGHLLSYEIPIFAALRDVLPGNRPYNKTIFSVVEEEKIPKMIEAIEQIMGSLDQPGTGIVFTLAVENVRGLASEFSI
jgi:nitrogen regulatory protein PII